MPPKITCGRRGEKGCKEVPEVCKWVNGKCVTHEQAKDANEVNESPKNGANVDTDTDTDDDADADDVVAKLGKLNIKEKAHSKGKESPKANSNVPKWFDELSSLKHRHCVFYPDKIVNQLEHVDVVDLKSKLKAPYSSSFKSDTNTHIGQRKLLISEIQLLTEYFEKNTVPPTVLYIGAAPGTHLHILSCMFPSVFFVLYDGVNIDAGLKKHSRFEVHDGENGFVTTAVINRIKDNMDLDHLLFVCDIRLNKDDFEAGVESDMRLQQDWMQILSPKLSLLKFRLSYKMKHGDKYSYEKGTLLYGVWPKATSGETRLLVEKKDVGKLIDYDFASYEEVLFFHNKYERPFCFQPKSPAIKKIIFQEDNKYCPCYDCVAELKVLERYAKLVGGPRSDYQENLDKVVKSLNIVTECRNKSKPVTLSKRSKKISLEDVISEMEKSPVFAKPSSPPPLQKSSY